MQQGARSARVCHSGADPGPGGGSSRPNSWGAGQPQPPPAALATAPPALVGHGDGAVIWRHSPRSESGQAASDTYRPVQRSGAAGGLASRRRYPHFPGPGRSAASSSQLLHCHLMTVSCQPDSECGHRGSAPPRRRDHWAARAGSESRSGPMMNALQCILVSVFRRRWHGSRLKLDYHYPNLRPGCPGPRARQP